ncbi:hypothetical protein NW761_011136 [Fusarium oxysporum]|nr:hypothetical protein NW758_012249 [Fusarium oxysporum]KAJ4079729.1 hypothetical protein NW761_011136 [Fusarium oxysporum]KAJ4119118.1 hypothetical protein NW769_001720 [Fusarium oxysporum]KAJ4221261.1 hypothetical protein NW760_011608 [Fusarium oxysporum]
MWHHILKTKINIMGSLCHTQSHIAQNQHEYLLGLIQQQAIFIQVLYDLGCLQIHKGGQIRYDDPLCIAIDNRVFKGASSNLPRVKAKHAKCNQQNSESHRFSVQRFCMTRSRFYSCVTQQQQPCWPSVL